MTRAQVASQLTQLEFETSRVAAIATTADTAELVEAIGCLITGFTSLIRVLDRSGDDAS